MTSLSCSSKVWRKPSACSRLQDFPNHFAFAAERGGAVDDGNREAKPQVESVAQYAVEPVVPGTVQVYDMPHGVYIELRSALAKQSLIWFFLSK